MSVASWRRVAGAVRSRSGGRWNATGRRSRTGSAIAGPRLKKARRLKAYLVFLDESGFLLLPTVRRTWAPRGETPLLRHRYRRDKVSAISAVTVSPRRHRCGLYAHSPCDNITQGEVALFLQLLLRHLAGPAHRAVGWRRDPRGARGRAPPRPPSAPPGRALPGVRSGTQPRRARVELPQRGTRQRQPRHDHRPPRRDDARHAPTPPHARPVTRVHRRLRMRIAPLRRMGTAGTRVGRLRTTTGRLLRRRSQQGRSECCTCPPSRRYRRF